MTGQDIRQGYKQTELGVIPEDWAVSTIGKEMKLTNGRAFKPSEWGRTGLPIIRIQNLNDLGADFNYCSDPVDEKNFIRKGDLLFAWSGTLGTSFGARRWLGPNGVLNQHIFKVEPHLDVMTADFALLVLGQVQTQIEKQSHGFKASFVHVKKSDLVGVELGFPMDLSEQRAIAAALSDADGLIAALEAMIAKKRDLKQAAMQNLLTGKTRLPGFSGEWEVKRLGDLLEYEQPTKYLVSSTDYDDSYDIPVLTAGKSFLLGYTNERHGVFTQLPVIIFDDFTTATQFVDFPFKAKSSAMKLLKPRNPQVNLRLVYDMMQTIKFEMSDHKRYWISEYQKIEVPFPNPAEQTAIAEVLSDMDADLAALEARVAKARAVKQGMMQELLTGKVRLV